MNRDLLEQPAADPGLWLLDPEVTFLNHGSFGACPRAVLESQRVLQNRMERQPVRFLFHELEGLLDEARTALAQFVGGAPDDLVFVANATEGVNTVLRSLDFKPGDELLVTDQEYNACRNALDVVAQRSGATVAVAAIPFPLPSAEHAVQAVLAHVTPRTRLALVDHVTSQTGLILPIARIVAELAARGVDTLVDGAHAPGMVPLDLRAIGAAYYTGNCHKWLCSPKAAGFLHVRTDRQPLIHPLATSHGANSPRIDRSRFLIEFAWTGTHDPSACLSVPEAIRFMGALLPGGWPQVMARNRELALAARTVLCGALNVPPPCSDGCIGSLASVPLPEALSHEWLAGLLREKHHFELPVIPWPAPTKRVIRVSAQLYNSLPEYRRLADVLTKLS